MLTYEAVAKPHLKSLGRAAIVGCFRVEVNAVWTGSTAARALVNSAALEDSEVLVDDDCGVDEVSSELLVLRVVAEG